MALVYSILAYPESSSSSKANTAKLTLTLTHTRAPATGKSVVDREAGVTLARNMEELLYTPPFIEEN
jgi:hypothetical protein